jgi:hypothetical protein
MTPILTFCCVNQNETSSMMARGSKHENIFFFSLIFTLSIKCNQCVASVAFSFPDSLMEIGIQIYFGLSGRQFFPSIFIY